MDNCSLKRKRAIIKPFALFIDNRISIITEPDPIDLIDDRRVTQFTTIIKRITELMCRPISHRIKMRYGLWYR